MNSIARNRPSVGVLITFLVLPGLLLSACVPENNPAAVDASFQPSPTPSAGEPTPTALPTRPPYQPGELVDYTAQSGDTLPALAAHFNTTVDQIRQANPILPVQVTTLPAGLPMKIPIYYQALWGSPYKILPDSLFVDGPAQVGFDTQAFVDAHPGWLKNYVGYAADENRSGANMVDYMAVNYSVSPRLILAILEYQSGALSQADPPPGGSDYALGFTGYARKGLFLQLDALADTLNDGYYAWRTGTLPSFDLLDGRLERPDPWLNAASVALHYYFSRNLQPDAYALAVSGQGLARTYQELFGDPWAGNINNIPGSLQQPALRLPFVPGKFWAFTGGPHTGWGTLQPYAALDFAPPSLVSGCAPSNEWVTAMADGVVSRSEEGLLVIDLDGDGDERTGWQLYYLHLIHDASLVQGVKVTAGEPIGHPSCEHGHATGTHAHVARKYNGEWIPAGGPLAFDLEGWVASAGAQPYDGTLTKSGRTITACTCSDKDSQLESEAP